METIRWAASWQPQAGLSPGMRFGRAQHSHTAATVTTATLPDASASPADVQTSAKLAAAGEPCFEWFDKGAAALGAPLFASPRQLHVLTRGSLPACVTAAGGTRLLLLCSPAQQGCWVLWSLHRMPPPVRLLLVGTAPALSQQQPQGAAEGCAAPQAYAGARRAGGA